MRTKITIEIETDKDEQAAKRFTRTILYDLLQRKGVLNVHGTYEEQTTNEDYTQDLDIIAHNKQENE